MKIGILGGSFNPAHEGHLKISLTAIELLNLDKVYWLITKKNPLKTESEYLPFEIRCKEAEKIIGTNNIELNYAEQKTESSYIIDNLRYLKTNNTDTFIFLMGADSFVSLNKWKNYESILDEFPIVVFNRENSEEEVINGFIGNKYSKFRLNLSSIELLYKKTPSWIFVQNFYESISSTKIR